MSDLGNREVFAANLRRLMDAKGISAAEVCDYLGVPRSTFSNWCTGKSYPRIDKIELMARFFGCQKSDLVETPETVHAAKMQMVQKAFSDRPGMVQLFSALDGATEEEIAQAIKVIEALKKG